MTYYYSLWIASTGKKVLSGKSNFRMSSWKKTAIKNFLKDKRRSEEDKELVRAGDVDVSWDNYDTFVKQGMSPEDLAKHCRKVWRDVKTSE